MAQDNLDENGDKLPPEWTGKTTWTWTLAEPIVDASGGKYDQITLREPKAGEIFDAKKNGKINNTVDADLTSLTLIAAVSGKKAAVIRELPVRTYRDMDEYLGHFM